MKNKILVTGAAGFIGYHLCKSLINDGYKVAGIDNLNSYYNVSLKNDRIANLSKKKNFHFNKIDIIDKSSLKNIFNKFKPNLVVNLAAQAGVRYSLENPYAYVDSNIVGFLNIIELCRKNNIENFVYASSSSVYGGNSKIPFSVEDRVDNPMSLYAATKKTNELIAHSYSHLYDMNTTGLRFFTAYGPWGRPDMAMYIFADKMLRNQPIEVFNNGEMNRDFTYIDDIIAGTRSAIDHKYKCEVFNLGNSKSEKLMDVISLLEKYLQKSAKINFRGMQPGDIENSFADIDKSVEMLNYNPKTNVDIGILNFIKWFKSYHSIV